MPTNPPVATVSPPRIRLAASSALTIFPLSSALTGARVRRTASADMSPPRAFASLIADIHWRASAAQVSVSVDPGQIVKRDDEEHRHGFRQRDHEHVLV